ncbi:MAG: homocitrate synthase/isopropylmalate synthase family protein, partial [Pyrinomonadaceae bacterium]
LVLGKHSGRHALSLRYAELGRELLPAELDEVYQRFTELADRKKRIYDQDLLSLLSLAAKSGGARPRLEIAFDEREVAASARC